jgi:hypothetical protein
MVRKIVRSFIISLLFTVAFLFSLHLSGKWTLSDGITKLPHDNYFNRHTDTSIILVSYILDCYNECLLFNQKHQTILFNEIDKKEAQTTISRFRLANSFSFTFDNHLLEIFLISLIGIPIVYFSLGVRKKMKQ